MSRFATFAFITTLGATLGAVTAVAFADEEADKDFSERLVPTATECTLTGTP